ncbi:MAG: hypothetical protein ABSG35_01650 [Syntrophobacteraceae bacterium]
MKRDYRDYLEDILAAIDESAEFTRDISFEAFTQDRKTINAVVRSLDDADDLLRQLNIEAQARHFKLIFIFLPSNTSLYESEINDLRNLMAKNNSPYLNLRESLKTCSGSQSAEKYFLKSDVCHFSVEGNGVFAEIIYHDRANLRL